MERTHEPMHLDKWNFVHLKIMEISTSLISITVFLYGPLNMEVFQNYEVMLGQTMNYFVWNSVILCSDIYL
jgi:hypothetical protein